MSIFIIITSFKDTKSSTSPLRLKKCTKLSPLSFKQPANTILYPELPTCC
uniref:Uncharacterized protein n=1 Tax=Microplitis mediator bracovirus TaxID=1836595 RepID=A0A2I6SH22_9VIRU|nr:hypothetical protein MmBV_CPP4 [Microplitis mediator bracovirus]